MIAQQPLEQKTAKEPSMSADPPSGEISELLTRWSSGENSVLDHLLPLIYKELRKLAKHYLRRERADHTLQATELVHEAFMRLAEQNQIIWRNRKHFFGVAAQMMRRVLVDHARQHLSQKRGSGAAKLPLEEAILLSDEKAPELLALDDALTSLEATHPDLAHLVELRFFGGLTFEELAELEKISQSSIKRQIRLARARLFASMTDENHGNPS